VAKAQHRTCFERQIKVFQSSCMSQALKSQNHYGGQMPSKMTQTISLASFCCEYQESFLTKLLLGKVAL
jgi:hypothetical protein